MNGENINHKVCEVCGKEEKNVHYNRKLKFSLCQKHSGQLAYYGKFLDNNQRTINDPNEVFIYPEIGIAEIVLYDIRGNPHKRAKIDICDLKRCLEYKWRAVKKDKWYVQNNKRVYLARFIMNNELEDSKQEIDHKNGDTLDNRRCNLRVATRSQNASNCKPKKSSKVGIRGVHIRPDGTWGVDFQHNKKRIYTKPVKTKQEAVTMRYLLELFLLGEFRYSGNDSAYAEHINTVPFSEICYIADYVICKIEQVFGR